MYHVARLVLAEETLSCLGDITSMSLVLLQLFDSNPYRRYSCDGAYRADDNPSNLACA
jgi:hypothetical protein